MEKIRDAYIDIALQPEAKIRTVREVYQYDYGIALKISGMDTQRVVELHFAHEGQKAATTVVPEIVDDCVVAEIPYAQLEQRKTIVCYIYTEEDDTGYTVYEIRMPVRARVKPTKTVYSEEESNNYDRQIAHLNGVIDDVEDQRVDLQTQAEELRNMQVLAETLNYNQEATATWDAENATLILGIPRGEPGDLGNSGSTLVLNGGGAYVTEK